MAHFRGLLGMTRPKIVIVGAGLGGSMLANALLATHDVSVIERGSAVIDPRFPVVDVGLPARTDPHFGSGLGGSTQLWHNGLIEIEEEIFASYWPIQKSDLDQYYEKAFLLLSGVPREKIRNAIVELRKKYQSFGLPGGLLPGLYYPRWPMNVWQSLKLDGRVEIIRGDVVDFQLTNEKSIGGLTITSNGQTHQVSGDVFVLAAGGLGSPILLQKLSRRLNCPALRNAGCYYEDHPMGFVGEVELTTPLYQLWNFHVPGTGGNLRLPLVVSQNGMHISFQLRPSATYYRNHRRLRVDSVLNKLRQNPWNFFNYAKLFSHWDDILDILSFKFGIRLPTKKYTLLMMAQMPSSEECSIWSELDPNTGQERRVRRWILSESFQNDLKASVDTVLEQLNPVIKSARVFPEWLTSLSTGAHHSGTARMSETSVSGVCDRNCRVHGISNLYICDGSVIPASGIANTGLTISALALRLAKHLCDLSKKQVVPTDC
jgi:choline dehydrogenase-like flavoprotein